MSIKQTKFNALNDRRKETAKNVSRSLNLLLEEASNALKQQAYMRSNPDDNGADELVPIVQVIFDQITVTFMEVQDKLEDLVAVRNGTMTVEDLITKHSIDLNEYSEELINT